MLLFNQFAAPNSKSMVHFKETVGLQFYVLTLVFLTTGIKAKGNSQKKRVLGSSGSNGGIWKV